MSGKTLLLSYSVRDPENLTSVYEREFVKNGALYADYGDLYRRLGLNGTERAVKELIAANGLDTLLLLLYPAAFHLRPSFLQSLRPGVFIATACGDSAYYFETRDKYYAGASDLFLAYDSFETVAAFRRLGGEAELFAPSYDTARYCKLPGLPKDIPVSFVGAVGGRPDRQDYIAHLRANGVDVRVFGYGAEGGPVSMERMVEIFNRSAISLNFTGASAFSHLTKHLQPGTRQIKGRLAEAALCGSFLLTETAPGIENLLKPGLEMDVFSTKDELLAKVRRYLADPAGREAAAGRALERARREYDAALAVPRLLAELAAARARRTRTGLLVPEDAAFRHNFASYRMLYLIRFVKALRPGLAFEELLELLRGGLPDFRQFYTFFVEEVVDSFPGAKAFLKRLFLRR